MAGYAPPYRGRFLVPPRARPIHVRCPRRGGSGVEKGGDACVALHASILHAHETLSHPGRRKRPHSTQHHSRPYANDALSQPDSRKTYP